MFGWSIRIWNLCRYWRQKNVYEDSYTIRLESYPLQPGYVYLLTTFSRLFDESMQGTHNINCDLISDSSPPRDNDQRQANLVMESHSSGPLESEGFVEMMSYPRFRSESSETTRF